MHHFKPLGLDSSLLQLAVHLQLASTFKKCKAKLVMLCSLAMHLQLAVHLRLALNYGIKGDEQAGQ